MQTLIYSVLHFLVDGLCALSMYAFFRSSPHWVLYILIYNFCAFALQAVFGAGMDLLKVRLERKNTAVLTGSRIGAGKTGTEDGTKAGTKTPAGGFGIDLPAACTLAGLIFTIAGAFIHPAVLGVGNALFHVGGGIGTIEEDRRKNLKGRALGIFVAPGAMGLYMGTCVGKTVGKTMFYVGSAFLGFLMLAVFATLVYVVRKRQAAGAGAVSGAVSETLPGAVSGAGACAVPGVMSGVVPVTASKAAFGSERGVGKKNFSALLAGVLLCFMVVVLRSYTGFAVSMTWKTGYLMGFLATAAIVLGKMFGGILGARFGMLKVTAVSLAGAAVCYFFCGNAVCGIAALLLFNMTMPLTLYLAADSMKETPGFAFGLLTLALFIGVLPSYFGVDNLFSGNITGALSALASLLMLGAAIIILKNQRGTK